MWYTVSRSKYDCYLCGVMNKNDHEDFSMLATTLFGLEELLAQELWKLVRKILRSCPAQLLLKATRALCTKPTSLCGPPRASSGLSTFSRSATRKNFTPRSKR